MHEYPNLPRARARLIEQLARSLIVHFGAEAFSVASQQANAAKMANAPAAKSWNQIALKIRNLQALSDAPAPTTDRNPDGDSEHIAEDAELE